MSAPLLHATGLVKRFGNRTAVQGVSLSIQPGEAVGLLGPNGAGKTTTISLLTGLLRPDAGQVLIEGRPLAGDTDPIKRRLGLVPQDLALYEELSAQDNLQFFGALQGLAGAKLTERAKFALQFVGLADRAQDDVKAFSGGMKRRLNLAVALLHDPQLLLLDEPTVGVDPQSRNAIFDNIEALRRRGKTILYTTHYMEEVERLCDRVVIMDDGQIIADDTLTGLKRRPAGSARVQLELTGVRDHGWVVELTRLAGILGAEFHGSRLTVQVADLHLGLAATLEHLRRVEVAVISVESHQPSLEDVFLELTGRSLRDM